MHVSETCLMPISETLTRGRTAVLGQDWCSGSDGRRSIGIRRRPLVGSSAGGREVECNTMVEQRCSQFLGVQVLLFVSQ
jgi:hypothetical protein